jgi:hypothetical protein
MTWARADGRPVDAGFQAAADQCRSAASRMGGGASRSQRDDAMMAAMQRCMEQRGYVWQCESPLGELAPGSCSGGDGPADKGPRPAKS